MSLQVWLPLTGDLHNQGLTNIEIVNNNVTVNNNGKIGQCYYFNAWDQYLKLMDYSEILASYNTFTISLWFKCIAQNTEHTGSALVSTGSWNHPQRLINLAIGNFETDHYTKLLISNTSSWSKGYSHDFYLNQWYHVTITNGNGALKAYVNGQLIGDTFPAYTVTSNPEQTWVCIGNATHSTNFKFLGYMNDVRIYDHCLSAKEVEELSRGLVLHYKLDNNSMGSPNLISDSVYNVDPWSSAIVAHELYYDKYAYRIKNNVLYNATNSGTTDIFNNTITYKTNTQYTLSLEWRDDYRTDNKNSALWFAFVYTDNTIGSKIQSPANTITSWTHHTMTSVVGKTVAHVISGFGNTGQLYVANIKIEEGTEDTGWALPLDQQSTIIYDSSGYGNHGIASSDFILQTDTPRYHMATYLNATSSDKRIESTNAINIPTDAISVSFWVKANKSTNQVLFADPKLEFGLLNSLGYVIPTASSTSFAITDFVTNAWNHIVVIRQESNYKLYINGVEQTRGGTNNYYVHNGTKLYLFNRNYNNNYAANATLSDFRVYATALSADAIKELYKTSVTIDSFGAIYARQFKEKANSTIQIKKQGLLLADITKEKSSSDADPDKASFLQNKTAAATTLYEY